MAQGLLRHAEVAAAVEGTAQAILGVGVVAGGFPVRAVLVERATHAGTRGGQGLGHGSEGAGAVPRPGVAFLDEPRRNRVLAVPGAGRPGTALQGEEDEHGQQESRALHGVFQSSQQPRDGVLGGSLGIDAGAGSACCQALNNCKATFTNLGKGRECVRPTRGGDTEEMGGGIANPAGSRPAGADTTIEEEGDEPLGRGSLPWGTGTASGAFAAPC